MEIVSWRAAWKLSLIGLLFVASLAADGAAIVAHDGWVRLPPKLKTETALYVILENHSSQPRAVVSGTSDVAATVELHQMTMQGKIMGMFPVSSVDIPAHGKRSFDPDGYHIMLFGLRKQLAVGDTVTVILKLDDGTTVPVTAAVRKK